MFTKFQPSHSISEMIKTIKKTIAKATWPRRRKKLRAKLRAQALADMRHLQPTAVKEAAIRASKHLLICCLNPESSGLEVFLNHYRGMGVDHMLLVDDSGSEDVATMLASQSDCSVWKPLLGLWESEYGKRFFHSLQQTYCLGKWTLCVEPEELFIFPYMETRRIQDLTGQLDDCDRTTLWAFEIETYGAGPVLQTERSLDEVRYFDPAGYYQTYGKLGQFEVRGGPGMRFAQSCPIAGNPDLGQLPADRLFIDFPEAFETLLSASRLDLAPCVDRMPLVKPDEAFFLSVSQPQRLGRKK